MGLKGKEGGRMREKRWEERGPKADFKLGGHREGRREGVKLLKDLHRLLKNLPPLLKKPPPASEEAAHLLFPLLNASS